MLYKNTKSKYMFLICIIVLVIFLFIGCEEGTGKNAIVLGFLPSGIEVATGNRLLHNTDYRVVTLIPVLEPFICIIISAICNIFDFLLWFIAWIPGIKQIIALIYSLPDIDQIFRNIFPNHRNFITHSVLNPGFIITILIGFILGKINESFKAITFLIASIFAVHFFADMMPLKWGGVANIYIGIGSYRLFALPSFLSKAWLMGNGILALHIASLVSDE